MALAGRGPVDYSNPGVQSIQVATITLHQGALPQASSASLAAQLLGQITSVSRAALRAEIQVLLQEAIDWMDPIDRKVIVLRHFEELTNDEVATFLGLTKAAASKRYVRAMLRLRAVIGNSTGLANGSLAGGNG